MTETNETREHGSANEPGRTSPGEILRRARVAHDYSIEDLCAQTRLTPSMVAALEDNDFQSLSQPVFARGYYRRCAKVLDIDTDRLMSAYDEHIGGADAAGPPGAAVPPTRDAARRSSRGDLASSRSRRTFRVVAGAGVAVAVLLALVILWPTLTGRDGGSETPQTDADKTPTTARAAANHATSDSGAGQHDRRAAASTGDAARATGAGMSHTADEGRTNGQAPANGRVVTDTRIASDAPADAGGLPSGDATSRNTGARNTEQSAAIAADDAPRTSPPASGEQNTFSGTANAGGKTTSSATAASGADTASEVAPNRLKLVFHERCWVSVQDADGKRLLIGIFTPGQTQTVSGSLPYRLDIGVAEGVDVTLGGQPIDLAPHTRGGVARFTLNPRGSG